MKTIFCLVFVSQFLLSQTKVINNYYLLTSNDKDNTFGEELIIGGQFNDETGWLDITASWSISGGTANYDAINNYSGLYSTFFPSTLTSGTTIRLTFTISGATGQARVVFLNNLTAGFIMGYTTAALYDNGTYEIATVTNADATRLIIFAYNDNGGGAFTIDNVSLKTIKTP